MPSRLFSWDCFWVPAFGGLYQDLPGMEGKTESVSTRKPEIGLSGFPLCQVLLDLALMDGANRNGFLVIRI